LAYLRQKSIVHRDLKPANIVLNEKMQIQLTDFGTAKSMFSASTSNNSASDASDISYVSGNSNISAISGMSNNTKSALSRDSNERIPLQANPELPDDFDELVGSEYYISPEMLEQRHWSYATDLWALGIIVFQFFAGKVPFKGKTQDDTFELIKKCTFTIPSDIPKDAKDLISKLLKRVPEERIGAQNINDVLSHPFF